MPDAPIDKLIAKFRTHYAEALDYKAAQALELKNLYQWMRQGFADALYDEVIRIHHTRFRVMPDVAIIEHAINAMNAPAVYDQPAEQLALPEPDAVDRVEDVQHITAVLTGHADARPRDTGEPEINHRERERVRVRAMKGDATSAEAFWIGCIDNHEGNWRAAWKAAAQAADSLETGVA
jgi:hypothetical protein